MKPSTKHSSSTGIKRAWKPALIAAIVAICATAAPVLAGAGNQGNPGIIPPHAKFRGKTYGEWSAEWWRWALSLPTTAHPLLDTGDCSEGQSGKVWFLGGTFVVTEVSQGVVLGQGRTRVAH